MGLKEMLVKADRDDPINPGKKLPIGKYRDGEGQLRNAVDTINDAAGYRSMDKSAASEPANSTLDKIKSHEKTLQGLKSGGRVVKSHMHHLKSGGKAC